MNADAAEVRGEKIIQGCREPSGSGRSASSGQLPQRRSRHTSIHNTHTPRHDTTCGPEAFRGFVLGDTPSCILARAALIGWRRG